MTVTDAIKDKKNPANLHMYIMNATLQRFSPIFIFCVKSLNDMLLKIALTSLAMLAHGFK